MKYRKKQVLRKLVKLLNSQNVNCWIHYELFAFGYNMGRRFRRNRVPFNYKIWALLIYFGKCFFYRLGDYKFSHQCLAPKSWPNEKKINLPHCALRCSLTHIIRLTRWSVKSPDNSGSNFLFFHRPRRTCPLFLFGSKKILIWFCCPMLHLWERIWNH